MSLDSEKNIKDYAHQCAMQRRRYEECLQKTQQSCQMNTSSEADQQLGADDDECLNQAAQSCVVELLGLTVEPLAWNDESLVSEASREAITGKQPATHQLATSAFQGSGAPISYSAP